MLRYLRMGNKHTKAIWWALTVITVVTFVGGFVFLFGAGIGGGGPRRGGAYGAVNGANISAQEYQNALNTQREAYRRRFGSDPAERDEKTVQEQAWQSLITERILGQQAKSLGLGATDREVVLALETSPPQELTTQAAFQTNGKFDPQKYGAALRDPNSTFWGPFEDLTRHQLPMRKLQERLLASIKLSEPELRQAFQDRYEKVSATVLEVPPVLGGKINPPTPADLDRVYAEFKGRFSSGPRVDAEVLSVPKKYSDEDIRTARQLAQSLVDRARNGEDFEALARDYSEGAGREQGGVINRVVMPAELGPELGPHVDALEAGKISDAYRDNGRFIILKVLERVPQPGSPVRGLKLAQIVVRVRPSENSLRDQYDAIQTLRDRARALKSLGKAATEKGFPTTKTGPFDMNNTPQALIDVPEAADWAFSANAGDVSPVFEGSDEFTVVQVATRHVGGPVPRDQLTETLRQIAEVEARVEQAKPTADRIAQDLAQGRSLEQAAKGAGLTPVVVKDMSRAQPDPRLNATPELVGALFGAAPGQLVGPLRLPGGWYFGRVDGRVAAPTDTTFEHVKGQLTTEILSQRQRTFFSGWLGDVRMKAKIQDLRYEGGR